MSLTPKQVLSKFNSKSTLVSIAERRGLNLTKQQQKRVADILAEDVLKTGINKVLHVLKKKELVDLSKNGGVDYEEERKNRGPHKEEEEEWFPQKQRMVEKLTEEISSFGVSQFFEQLSVEVLLECCKSIDDLSDMTEEELNGFTQDDLVNGVLTNIYTFGLQNLFSSFTVTELAEFADDCDLSVKSQAKEVLVDCIVEQRDYRKKKREVRKVEKKSDKKPKLKDGIKKVDLEQWYLRSELEDFCREKGMKISGNKRDIIKRILLYFEGDRGHLVMPGKKGRRSRSRSRSKSRKEEDSDE